MMFALRCLGVSLAFFLITYCLLSAGVSLGWRLIRIAGFRGPARRVADLLFALRCLPVVAASAVAIVFVVPSFLLLEPRVSSEPIGEIPLALGACSVLVLAVGVVRAYEAQSRTSQAVENWLVEATALPRQERVPVYRIRPAVPAFTVTGVCAPRVLFSEAAVTLLTRFELEAAMKHEIAHVRRRDNLKKLLFLLFGFPGMNALEAAWSDAEEMAADDAAVSSAYEALDLASALIKLSRLAPLHPVAALTTALVSSPAAAVNARVSRLVAWEERNADDSLVSWHWGAAMLGAVVSVAFIYGPVLNGVHALTEYLVR